MEESILTSFKFYYKDAKTKVWCDISLLIGIWIRNLCGQLILFYKSAKVNLCETHTYTHTHKVINSWYIKKSTCMDNRLKFNILNSITSRRNPYDLAIGPLFFHIQNRLLQIYCQKRRKNYLWIEWKYVQNMYTYTSYMTYSKYR